MQEMKSIPRGHTDMLAEWASRKKDRVKSIISWANLCKSHFMKPLRLSEREDALDKGFLIKECRKIYEDTFSYSHWNNWNCRRELGQVNQWSDHKNILVSQHNSHNSRKGYSRSKNKKAKNTNTAFSKSSEKLFGQI